MARPSKDVPTDREMQILHELWTHGPCTTREVLDALERRTSRKVAYSTVQTLLTIMHRKGLVHRDESRQPHVVEAAQTRDVVETRLIDHLADTAFGGSTMRVVARALSTRASTPKEAETIEHLLATLEAEGDADA